ncbi:MAG TPA: dihydroxyacetone kinase subunit L [Roseiflexaceae bacterium]|jgi:dihydroxyacetone kinase|nr:dihydroxyacetone kinase subunit L [Roseiflexaceae bacterium]
MASADTLVALFSAITQNLQQDRTHINQLDPADGDTGDNMADNFALVTQALAQANQQAGGQADIGALLGQAAQTLRQQGKGATAPIYAQGLADAGQRLQGQTSFSLDDLMPLLQGLLNGAQQASGAQPGQGSMLDVLLPGIMAFMQAKQNGASDAQAILQALLSVRRGANSTAGSGQGFGRAQGSDTTGRIDPGAAGAASLLEGLFGALLNGALRGGSTPQQSTPQPSAPSQGIPGLPGDLGGLIGGLFGGGQGSSSMDVPPSQAPTKRV